MPHAKRARRVRSEEAGELPYPTSEGALAVLLLRLGREAGPGGLVHLAASERRIERLARILWALAPDLDTILFPPWDCLPYDRISPSVRTMGLRVAALSRLAAGTRRPFILLATPEALIQRLPPRSIWAEATMTLLQGNSFDPEALAADLRRTGYLDDERVDAPGEFAVRGQVVDVFPAGYYLPVRLEHDEGRITSIASFDAASQRRTDEFAELFLRPASEAVLGRGDETERAPGIEHRLPELYPALETLFDYVPGAHLVVEPRAESRAAGFREQVRDAYGTRLKFGRGEARPVAPDRFYLDEAEQRARQVGRPTTSLVRAEEPAEKVPNFAVASRPNAALKNFVREQVEAGHRILLTAGSEPELARLTGRIEAAAGIPLERVEGWDAIAAAKPGSLLGSVVDLPSGFVLPEERLTAVAASDILGSRASLASEAVHAGHFEGEEEFRIGDTVIHLDHGVGVLRGVETLAGPDGEPTETIRLEYGGGAKLMVPVAQVGALWRYGGAGGKVALDRLDGESWPKRRARVEAEIGAAAAALARLAVERRAAAAPKLAPPRRDYERFVDRFPFPETPDQLVTVDDVLRDMESGHPMDRLVCGDVGFGKTEIALRAAAATVLAGKQVAIVAPTTVLVRQHLQTFRRRFEGFGIEIGHLSRLVKPAEAKAVKAGLKDGRVRIVIATHALAAKGVAFADLGLLVIDEEQRFGAAHKAKLRGLGEGVHVLAMTATPIPRTMQAALVGLQDVSTLRTPPAERQPVRTVVMPLDEATMRESLVRERRRGGQSFVVCPRIEDIAPMAARLRRLVPELETLVAHGKLPAEEIDEIMVRFADGDGDVLLATNIVESGLDVPRANTILVWQADRFGLGQLHQLRGRVGRGRERGTAYFLTDPEAAVPPATLKRLAKLEKHDRLGAGFAVSSEDLDQRGAGDLLGESQAGHLKLIGAGLYRRLLERALAAARGDAQAEEWTPELNIGVSGRIPDEYVPDAEMRLNLYARIARTADEPGEQRIADEIEDRFGAPPAEVQDLLATARLKRLCRNAALARIDAGPEAIALTFKEKASREKDLDRLAGESGGRLAWRGERLVLSEGTEEPFARLAAIEGLLDSLPAR